MKLLKYIVISFVLMTSTPSYAININVTANADQPNLWLLESHNLPIIYVNIVFQNVGSITDPHDKMGRAVLASAMLTKGAGDLDQIAFQEYLADHAIDIESDSSRDHLQIKMQFLSKELDVASRVLRNILSQTRLDEEVIEQEKTAQISRLRKKQEDPSYIAMQGLNNYIFNGHPYANPQLGTEETVAAITKQDIESYLYSYLNQENMHITMAGDLSSDDAIKFVDSLNAVLAPSKRSLEVDSVPFPEGTTIKKVADIRQPVVMFALPGLNYDHPDFYPLFVANHILGGSGFASSLMQTLREDQGLVYGVWSSLLPYAFGEVWLGKAATQPETLSKVMFHIRQELEMLREKGVDAEALRKAKRSLMMSYDNRFTSLGETASALSYLQAQNLPISFINNRNQRVKNVTLEQVNQAVWNHIDLFKLVFLTVVEK